MAHYDALRDFWEIMAPIETRRRAANAWENIPVHERKYVPVGVRSYPRHFERDEDASVSMSYICAPIRRVPPHSGMEGTIVQVYNRQDYRWYWQRAPANTIAGRGKLTVTHYGSLSDECQVHFEKPALRRTINKEKWLEKRRMRAVHERSLRVLQKLGSVAAENLPDGFEFDLEKAAAAYQNLLASLHPDCPAISAPDMEYFGQCVLWQARQVNYYFRLPPTHSYYQEPNKKDLDTAFDNMRRKLRTKNYAMDDVYEYELDSEYATEARFFL